MSRLKILIEVQVFWHIQNSLPDVLLYLLGVFLWIFTSERIPLCDEVEKTTAQRPDVRLNCQIAVVFETLR